MLNYEFLVPFEQEEFSFKGARCFHNEKKAFLLSDSGTSIILDLSLLSEIENKSVSEDLALKLYQRGFATVFNRQRFSARRDEIKPTLFMIDFTTKCNCNCIYCLRHFEDSGDSITTEQLDKITDYIISYCKAHDIDCISFQPWGGEPLIELEKIIRCKKRFEQSGVRASFNVQTNGLLLSLENYKKLRDNDIHIGVSVDGIEEVHDAHRTDVRGNKTHRKIVDNIKAIVAEYPDCNIGTLSVNSAYSMNKISENVDYIVNRIGISNLKLNLVHPGGGSDFDNEMLIPKEKLAEYIKRVLDSIIEQIEKGNRCYESNIVDKICNLLGVERNNMCNSKGCRGGATFISFDRDGNIYPCEMIGRTEMKLGNISDGEDLIELILKAQNVNPYYAPRKTDSCADCPFYYYCRGGCKACSLAYGKEAAEIDTVECEINKALYPLLIELILEKPHLVEKILDYRYRIR